MAAVVDTLITKYVLDDQYSAKMHKVTASTRSAQGGIGGFQGMIQKLAQGGLPMLLAAINPISLVVGALTAAFAAAAAAAVGFTAGLTFLLTKGSQAAMQMEQLRMGLRAYAGTAEETDRQMKRLTVVARAPGLGLAEAMQGSVSLQAAGFNSTLAEKALLGFGNALALVGKGRVELQGVILALSQIASKGVVSAEEINQIAERVPQIRQIMQKEFGTASTEALAKMGISAEEFITRIVDRMQDLPKATGTFANSLENLKDIGFQAFANIGQAINDVLAPKLELISNFVDYLNDQGIFKKFGEGIANLLGGGGDEGLIKILANIGAIFEKLPSLMGIVRDEGVKMLEGFVGLFNKFIEMFNKIGASRIGRLWGIGSVAPVAAPGVMAGGAVARIGEWYRSDVAPRAEELAKGYSGFSPTTELGDDGTPGFTGGGGKKSPVAQDIQKIRDNTAKLVDLQEAVVGGSVRGQAALSAVNMSGGAMERRIARSVLSMVGGAAAAEFGRMSRRR